MQPTGPVSEKILAKANLDNSFSGSTIDHWRKKNKYFYRDIEEFHYFLTGPGQKIAEIGVSRADIANTLKPRATSVVGSETCQNPTAMGDLAKQNYDYVIAHGFLSIVDDVQQSIKGLAALCTRDTRVIVSTYNAFWQPLLDLGAKFGMRSKTKLHNWLSDTDLENLFFLEDLEVVSKYKRILLPKYVPGLSWFANKVLLHLPLFHSLALMRYHVLRKRVSADHNLTSSIVIPARNEAGNIENAIKRLPAFGSGQEVIFVEGNSTDNTWAEIERIRLKYHDRNIVTLRQPGKGKGDAVRHGFAHATGDVLFILDADLTVPPEDLPKFYEVIATGKGEFANGTRLVYPMEAQAMRFLNLLGNKFFAWMFSWLLSQKFRDTLCGTKVLTRAHYQKIADNRSYFGNFDPFGDFDLLFGAAKQNLKIVEIPIRYKERTYGETNISRFSHGWLLLKMCVYAAKKIKFR